MKTTIAILASALVLAACADDSSGLRPRSGNPDDPNAPATPPADPNAPSASCEAGREYLTLDKKSLTINRADLPPGGDRGRVKPFSALQTEYPRVLGSTPASLADAATTFGTPDVRWYEEPTTSSVALQTAYGVAFDGCLTYVATEASMAAAPDATSAAAACASMARRFWSKTPTPDEIQACVDVAVTGAASEPQVAKKWAYACASLLTSANFLTY